MSSTTSQDTQVGRTIRSSAWGWALLALGLVGIGGLAIREMDMNHGSEPCVSLTVTEPIVDVSLTMTDPSVDLNIVTLLPVNFDGDNRTFLQLNDDKLGEANCTSGFAAYNGILQFIQTVCCHGSSMSEFDVIVRPTVTVQRTGKFALNCESTNGTRCVTSGNATYGSESFQLTVHDDQSNHYAIQMGGPLPLSSDYFFSTPDDCNSPLTSWHPSDPVAAVLLLHESPFHT